MAAEQTNALAQARLAKMYYEGRGVERDPVESLKWRLLAAAPLDSCGPGCDSEPVDPIMDWLENLDDELSAEEVAEAEHRVALFKDEC